MKKISLEKYFIGVSKDSLIYGAGNAVLKIMALITAPIFTRIFLPAEYGLISLIASLTSFLNLVLIFGMDNALFVSFYEYKKEREKVTSSAFWFLALWGFLVAGFACLFSGSVSNLIFHTSAYRTLLLLAFSSAYLALLISFGKVTFRLKFQAKRFALVAILNALLTTGLMILFVAYLHQGLKGYFLGSLVGTGLTMILALLFVRNSIKLALSYKHLKEMVKFGSMVLPASVSFFVFDLSDRFFLNHYWDLREIGLYSIAINIASLIVFFSYALGQAWSPQVMNIYFKNKKIYHQFVPRFFLYYMIFFFIVAVGLSLFGLEVLRIFATEKFYAAATVIGPLSLAMVLSASNQVTSLGITISRKTKYFALYTALAALLNIGLNFLLIPKYGMIGAGWATVLSYLFLTVAYFVNSQKFIPIKIDWQKMFKLVLLSLAVILLFPISQKFTYHINFAVRLGGFFGFLALLYYLGVVEKFELIYLRNYLKKFLKVAK